MASGANVRMLLVKGVRVSRTRCGLASVRGDTTAQAQSKHTVA